MTLRTLIRQAYPSPEWAVFFEVSNATGSRATRRADAVAVGVWPSRGHQVVGFEFKEDRRDWLRELKNPAKADTIAAHCDTWWVVAGSDGIVRLEELPSPWGLCVASKNRVKLNVVKPSVPFAERDTSTMRRSFVAAMLRKVTETMTPNSEISVVVDAAVKDALARERTHRDQIGQTVEDKLKNLQRCIETFQTTSGVNIRDWHGPETIGIAVKAVLNSNGHRRALEGTLQSLSAASNAVQAALDAWPSKETA